MTAGLPSLRAGHHAVMDAPFEATPEIVVLPSHEPFLGRGFVPVNAFVIRGPESLLVDAGGATDETRFLSALWDAVPPEELRYILLTHEDWEHAGNVAAIMDEAPRAKLITTYLTLHSMAAEWYVDPDRVFLMNPGQRLMLGGLGYMVVQPPLYDSPGSIGLFSESRRALFSADAFGTFVREKVRYAEALPMDDLVSGWQDFALMHTPWLHLCDQKRYARGVEIVRRALRPHLIFSAHAPVMRGLVDVACDVLLQLPRRDPLRGPDDADFRRPRYSTAYP
jgi:glyoxylase-like metal-dependent hydrolase (beta-lactamase superfamily II)